MYGRGTFGEVYKCEHNDSKELYAVKVSRHEKGKYEWLNNETKLLNDLKDTGKVPVVHLEADVAIEDGTTHSVIVMDLLGKTLATLFIN